MLIMMSSLWCEDTFLLQINFHVLVESKDVQSEHCELFRCGHCKITVLTE